MVKWVCSLCKGSQMVLGNNGMMRKCPACYDRPTPKFNELYEIFNNTFNKRENMIDIKNKENIKNTPKKEENKKDKICYGGCKLKITPEELEEIERKTNEKLIKQLKEFSSKEKNVIPKEI